MLQGVGAGFSAGSAYNNSEATAAAYHAQGQIAVNNAVISEWQAQDAISRGERAAGDYGMKNRQLKGTQVARLAHNGVDLGVGSAAQILTDTDYFGEIDKQRITDNAAREAWGYRSQAQDFRSNAALLEYRSGSESPLMAGATSLLSSAGRVAAGWYDRNSMGGSPGDGLGQGDRRKRGVY